MSLPEHMGVPTAWTVHFGTDDLDATVARIEELGGSVVNRVDSSVGPLAAVADPQGAVFQVMQPTEFADFREPVGSRRRRTHMRPILALALLVAACAPGATGSTSGTAGAMAAALREVSTTDNTFGGEPVFGDFLVLASIDPAAGGSAGGPGTEGRALTDSERSTIEEALSPLGTVTWIEDADEWRTATLEPVIAGSAILGVGEPDPDGDDSFLVPVSLWCGGLCGTWLTYRVDLVAGEWVVVDIIGPVSVS